MAMRVAPRDPLSSYLGRLMGCSRIAIIVPSLAFISPFAVIATERRARPPLPMSPIANPGRSPAPRGPRTGREFGEADGRPAGHGGHVVVQHPELAAGEGVHVDFADGVGEFRRHAGGEEKA